MKVSDLNLPQTGRGSREGAQYSLERPREQWHLERVLFLERNGCTDSVLPQCPETQAENQEVTERGVW